MKDVITLPVTHMLVKRVHSESMALIVHVHMTQAILKSDMSTFSFLLRLLLQTICRKKKATRDDSVTLKLL